MGSGKRVLVVDDEPNVVATLSEALRMSGFQVITARDGIEALGACERYQPDGLVLDVMMPGENGYRVARASKERDRGPDDCLCQRSCFVNLLLVVVPRKRAPGVRFHTLVGFPSSPGP